MFTGLNWVLHTVGNYVGVYARGVTRSSVGQVAQKIGWNSHKNRGDDSHPNISICAVCAHTRVVIDLFTGLNWVLDMVIMWVCTNMCAPV